MGRAPNGPAPDIFDLFRFSSAGTRVFDGTSNPTATSPAPTSYFSLDGGTTKLGDYGTTSDPSDFLNSGVQGKTDAFNEFYNASTNQFLSTTDLLQLDALGFDTPVQTASSAADLSDDIRKFDLDSQATGGDGTHYLITLTPNATLTETSDIFAVDLKGDDTLTIDGQGATLDGAGQGRGLFVYSGNVTIDDLTIANAVATGGNGGSGGGGGGAGLGGGLFVADDVLGGAAPSHVTFNNVVFSGDSAESAATAQVRASTAAFTRRRRRRRPRRRRRRAGATAPEPNLSGDSVAAKAAAGGGGGVGQGDGFGAAGGGGSGGDGQTQTAQSAYAGQAAATAGDGGLPARNSPVRKIRRFRESGDGQGGTYVSQGGQGGDRRASRRRRRRRRRRGRRGRATGVGGGGGGGGIHGGGSEEHHANGGDRRIWRRRRGRRPAQRIQAPFDAGRRQRRRGRIRRRRRRRGPRAEETARRGYGGKGGWGGGGGGGLHTGSGGLRRRRSARTSGGGGGLGAGGGIFVQ